MRTKAPTELVLIQEISTLWSKAARGGPLAGARNSVPESLELPAGIPGLLPGGPKFPRVFPQPSQGQETREIYAHHAAYRACTRFAAPAGESWTRLTLCSHEPTTVSWDLNEPPLKITTGDHLNIEFHWADIGYSPRRSRPATHKELAIGQWLRLRYNVRVAHEECGWHYYKCVLNIGYAASPDPAFFNQTEPVQVISDMADLLW